ncbi:4-hydroxybenzoate transporter PcaK [Sporomusa silvacetica DSM 10669]|uniref:4-hydroxybenzoate transporter PcaK n=1 Tax=Sporomusa silvacetica DSM 10669 TaxID=1123289 RepID=A0ABZ3IU93_9FIRM|nr:aromatic acid/H+ symport family MFS transporter [Sporomusa silvacetica]OZC19684.1 gentisate transporter [Sporomusa silvacetica DSM 10669]
MAVINVKKLIDESSLNKSHLKAFLTCIVSLTFDGYDLVVFGATIPILLVAWNMSPAYAGLIGSYAYAAGILGAITGGYLGDRWGRKNTILLSIIIFSSGTLWCGLSSEPFWFGLARTLTGFGLGMTLQNEVALISEYFPARYNKSATTALGTGMQLGGIIAALSALWLLEAYGWQSLYYLGATIIVLFPVLFKYMPEAPWVLVSKDKRLEIKQMLAEIRPDVTVPDDATFEYAQAKNKKGLLQVFAERRTFSTILFWLIYFLNMYVTQGTNTWIPKLMIDKGHGLGLSLWLYLTMFIGAAIGSYIGGFFVDRIGAKRVVIVQFLCAFVSLCLLSLPMNVYLTFVVIAFVGVGTQGAMNVTHCYVTQFFPPQVKSTAMGWGLGLGRFGALFGPLIGGILLSYKATLFQSLFALAVPSLLAGCAALLVQDRYGYATRLAEQDERNVENILNS